MGIEMSVTEFKAKCLELIDKLSRHEIESIELTKRGKPVAVVSPPKPTREDILRSYGFMRGRIHIPEGVDIVGPIAADQEFEPQLPER